MIGHHFSTSDFWCCARTSGACRSRRGEFLPEIGKLAPHRRICGRVAQRRIEFDDHLFRGLLLMLWTAPPPARECHGNGAVESSHHSEEPGMQTITIVGLDIAKSVFQVRGVDAAGQVVVRRQLKRRYVLASFQKLPPCLIGIEACASAHHWARELQVLGHTAARTRRRPTTIPEPARPY
jgi:hypothetical protein